MCWGNKSPDLTIQASNVSRNDAKKSQMSKVFVAFLSDPGLCVKSIVSEAKYV